jgi:putative heme iron utilization protein
VFLLFWSLSARESRWVACELQQAKASKGLDWIRPMPIDDPATAPPPEDLKHLHFGDRYLIARDAFLRRKNPTDR